jgi:hypothetical protein
LQASPEAVELLQVSPEAVDLFRAIQQGNLDLVKVIWDIMQENGTLLSSPTPWKAVWHAVYRQHEDILLWLLRQDFPLDSNAFKTALPNERKCLLDLIMSSYGCDSVPDEVCRALIDRKVEINDVLSMSSLLRYKDSGLIKYAASHGYLFSADLYSPEIIDTYFTVQKIREMKHFREGGLSDLVKALIEFRAIDQLRELRTGRHKEEVCNLLTLSPEICVLRLSLALQEGWIEGARFFLDIMRKANPKFKLMPIHTKAASKCGRKEVMDWAEQHAPPST